MLRRRLLRGSFRRQRVVSEADARILMETPALIRRIAAARPPRRQLQVQSQVQLRAQGQVQMRMQVQVRMQVQM